MRGAYIYIYRYNTNQLDTGCTRMQGWCPRMKKDVKDSQDAGSISIHIYIYNTNQLDTGCTRVQGWCPRMKKDVKDSQDAGSIYIHIQIWYQLVKYRMHQDVGVVSEDEEGCKGFPGCGEHIYTYVVLMNIYRYNTNQLYTRLHQDEQLELEDEEGCTGCPGCNQFLRAQLERYKSFIKQICL